MFSKKVLSGRIKSICLEEGFTKVGFAKAGELKQEREYYRKWIGKGMNGDMNWLARDFEKRLNPKLVMEDVKSVISLAYLYNTPFKHSEDAAIPKISRYAWGDGDYHRMSKKKLKQVTKKIGTLSAVIRTKHFVDDGPIMEKAWAVKSGIGWRGKHSIVVNPDFGSFFFLSEILINEELDYDDEYDGLCRDCRICIDACPTGAIRLGGLNPNLCIAYHTIENRKNIPEGISLHGWIFGCDVCQNVCPYNKSASADTEEKSFEPKQAVFNKTYKELLQLSEEQFNTIFAGTPIKRAKYKRWRRNLQSR